MFGRIIQNFTGETLCKGSYSLGTACGQCARCRASIADIEVGKNLLAGAIAVICEVAVEEVIAMEAGAFMALLHAMQDRCRNLVEVVPPMREWGDRKEA